MRRTLARALVVVTLASPVAFVIAHRASEGFRRTVSWRLSRPYYAYALRTTPHTWQRQALIQRLGAREHEVYRGLLLRWADDETKPEEERRTAQWALLEHYPGTWPAEAAREFDLLAQRPTFFGRERRYDPYWVLTWGASAWSPESATSTSAARWERFLARYPTFVGAADAAFHLARAHHREGRPLEALRALDRARGLPDGRAGHVIDAAARHYALEQIPDEALERAAAEPGWHPETAYALEYARGLRRLRRLELEAAVEVWERMPEASRRAAGEPDPRWTHRPDEHLRERPQRRIEIVRALVPLERAYRAARGSPREATALLDLCEGVIAADRRLGPGLGFFEPWLLVDNELWHFTDAHLEPELVRAGTLATTDRERARALFLRAWLQRAGAVGEIAPHLRDERFERSAALFAEVESRYPRQLPLADLAYRARERWHLPRLPGDPASSS